MCVNDKKNSISICFSKIATTISASRKLVRMGRKICLFVFYTELIDAELRMKGAALKEGLEHWMVESKRKRGILKQCRPIFFFLHN
jgi:hypothetical protein